MMTDAALGVKHISDVGPLTAGATVRERIPQDAGRPADRGGMNHATATRAAPGTRAARRRIDPGNEALCQACGNAVKFAAKSKLQQVICNVYVDGRWNRVEHYHEACYVETGEPYGAAV
jgi:hypothetical protein